MQGLCCQSLTDLAFRDEQKYTSIKVVHFLKNAGLGTKMHTNLPGQQKGNKKYKEEKSTEATMTERFVVRLAKLIEFGLVEV